MITKIIKFKCSFWPRPVVSMSFCLILVSMMVGCLSVQQLPTYPSTPDQIARDFTTTLEVGFENENLQDLSRIIDDRYSGYSNGQQTLMSNMDEIFSQYDVLGLELSVEKVAPYSGGIEVRTRWILRWKCRTVNAERGCSEEKQDMIVVREGTTTFQLIQSGLRWTISQQKGNVLLGLFEPGDPVISIG